MKSCFPAVCFICTVFIFSCAGRRSPQFIPVPDEEYFKNDKNSIRIENIIETKNGFFTANMPVWFSAYINGGIEEVEKLGSYYGKYVFVGYNEGVNFSALNIWADNFSAMQDFSILAANRIERRMISSAVLYPDYEYGAFFEKMVKNSFDILYPGAEKVDTYWIKIKNNQESETVSEIYNFFILITIDKRTLQAIIINMMTETASDVSSTAAQQNAINRLRQTFFEGF